MLSLLNRFGRVLIRAFNQFNENRAGTQGAALSFFTVFALPPLLVLLVMVATIFLDDTIVNNWLLVQAQRGGGELGASMVKLILDNMRRPEGSNIFAGLVSFSMLVFSATNIFASLQDILNTIWGVKVRPEVTIMRMIVARLNSFALILALGLTVLATILLEVGLAVAQNFVTSHFEILNRIFFFQNLNRGIGFVLITMMFVAIFKFLPDVKMRWRDVLIGALFTSVSLALSRYLISWFLSTAQLGTAYGTMGSLIIFLFWLHLNLQIMLFGAEFTEAWASEGGAPMAPKDYAIWLPGRAPKNVPPANS